MLSDSHSVLDSSVLVLNRFYVAVHVISVRRAFTLLYCESAEVILLEEGRYASYDFDSWRLLSELHADLARREVAPREGDWLRTVGGEIRAPRVIRLLQFDGHHRRVLRFNRRNLFARDEHRCQYCGHRFTPDELSFDHVVPRSQGGETNWENVVCSCLPCNSRKGGRTPQEARMRLLRHPAQPKHNPLLSTKLAHPRYELWRSFLGGTTATLDLS